MYQKAILAAYFLCILGIATAKAESIQLPASSQEIHKKVEPVVFSDFSGRGWYVNAWGVPAPQYNFNITKDRAQLFTSNAAAVEFQLFDKGNGDAHLVYDYPFEPQKNYEVKIILRSDRPTKTTVALRRDVIPYESFGSQTVTLSDKWTEITLNGIFPYTKSARTSLRVIPLTMGGQITVGGLTINRIVKNDLEPPPTKGALAQTFFGMVVNKLGAHDNWPDLNIQIIRLWDTGTDWGSIQPERGMWNFSRADYYVSYAEKHGAQILFTLGQTPSWAASDASTHCTYKTGCSPPKNETDWRRYVRALSERYGNRVKYWEIWNEPDYKGFWNGTPAQLARLTEIAREEILRINHDAWIIGPSITGSFGLSFLDQFLAAGGGAFLNAVSFHGYFSMQTGSVLNIINMVRNVLTQHGIANISLWNTEMGGGNIVPTTNTAQQNSGYNPNCLLSAAPRALLVMAAKGIDNVDFYTWERRPPEAMVALSDPQLFKELTAEGEAYKKASLWLSNAEIIDSYVYEGVYVIRLKQGGEIKSILWAEEDKARVRMPNPWNYTKGEPLLGTNGPIDPSQELILSCDPVLLY